MKDKIADFTGTDTIYRQSQDLALLLRQIQQTDFLSLLESAQQKYLGTKLVIPVVGTAKRGKSTLVNALLGRADDVVAPIGELQTSNVCTRFEKGREEKASVIFLDGRTEDIPWSSIRDYVTEDNNPENAKRVLELHVTSPAFKLPDDVVLVDTPGAGSILDHHNDFILRLLPQSDAVIYLVTGADPISATEQKLLRTLKKEHIQKIIFLVNMKDALSPKDLGDGLEHNRKILAESGIATRILPISARGAMHGLPDSGISSILAELAETTLEQKLDLKINGLRAAISYVCESVENLLATEIQLGSQSKEDLTKAREALEKYRATCFEKIAFQEADYLRQTQTAIASFENGLLRAEDEAKRLVHHHVSQVIGADFGGFWKNVTSQDDKSLSQLSLFIANACEDEISPLAKTLQGELLQASERFLNGLALPELSSVSPGSMDHGSGGAIKTLNTYMKPGAMIAGGVLLNVVGTSLLAGAVASAGTTAAGVGGLVSWIPFVGGYLGSAVGGGASAVTTVIAGTALAPIGILLGVGCAAVVAAGVIGLPFAWRNSRLKTKEAFAEKARQMVADSFRFIRSEKIPALRAAVNNSAQMIRDSASLHLSAYEQAVARAEKIQRDPATIGKMNAALANIKQFLPLQA